MTGNVHWDPKTFPGANCSSFRVFTDVQTGPRPLLQSDGLHYGVAPTKRIGQFSARAAGGHAALGGGGVSSCDYTVSAIARNWFHNTSATSLALLANSEGGSNPQVGNLHSAGYMLPVGWSGMSVIPDPIAANKDYEMLRGMAGSSGLGNPRLVMPGQKEERVSVYGIDPAVRIRQEQGPAAPVFVHQLPTSTAQGQGQGTATNSQAPAQGPQGNATAPGGQAPNGNPPDRTKIWQTGNGAATATSGEKSSINPQPLPPRILEVPAKAAATGSSTMGPGGARHDQPATVAANQQNGTNGIK
jgi:hypothetical protein